MTRSFVEEMLVEGLNDFTDPSWAVTVVWNHEWSPDNIRTAAIGVVAELLGRGYVTAGVVESGRFLEWAVSPGDALQRILSEWFDAWSVTFPTPGAIAWFKNTELGNAEAQGALLQTP